MELQTLWLINGDKMKKTIDSKKHREVINIALKEIGMIVQEVATYTEDIADFEKDHKINFMEFLVINIATTTVILESFIELVIQDDNPNDTIKKAIKKEMERIKNRI